MKEFKGKKRRELKEKKYKKQETRNKRQETRNKKQETRSKKQETRMDKQENTSSFDIKKYASGTYAIKVMPEGVTYQIVKQ